MEELINLYGTRWHDRLEKEGKSCEECDCGCTPEYVVSFRGFPSPSVFCSTKCLAKFMIQKHFDEEDIE